MDSEKIEKILKEKQGSAFYIKRYIKYLSLCTERNAKNTNGFFEAHHICPKAKDLYPEYKSFKENPWNKINLTPRQHIFAHLILSKIFPQSKSCKLALFQMLIKKHKLSDNRLLSALKLIEFSRKEASEKMKNTIPVYEKATGKKYRIKKEDFDSNKYYTCAYYSLNIAENSEDLKIARSKKRKNTVIAFNKETQQYELIDRELFFSEEKYIGVGNTRDEKSRKKTSDKMKNRKHVYNEQTGERLFLNSDEVIPEKFKEGLPDNFCLKAKERFKDNYYYYNPETKEQIRTKDNPPEGFVRGKIFFGENGNNFSQYSFGYSLIDGSFIKYKKGEKPKHTISSETFKKDRMFYVIDNYVFDGDNPEKKVSEYLLETKKINLSQKKLNLAKRKAILLINEEWFKLLKVSEIINNKNLLFFD